MDMTTEDVDIYYLHPPFLTMNDDGIRIGM